MGVQKVILKRTPDFNPSEATYTKADGTVETVGIGGKTGCLALGVPGNIYDASPARIHTAKLGSDAEIGAFVDGQGIIVNSREYALVGGVNPATDTHEALYPSLILSGGDAASFMTFGHVVVKCKNVENIFQNMNGSVLAGYNPSKGEGCTVQTCIVAPSGAGAYNASNWVTYDPTKTYPAKVATTSYAVGDLVTDSGTLKVCTTAGTGADGTFTAVDGDIANFDDTEGDYALGDSIAIYDGTEVCVIEVNGITPPSAT